MDVLEIIRSNSAHGRDHLTGRNLLTWPNKLSLLMQVLCTKPLLSHIEIVLVASPPTELPTYGRVNLRVCQVDSGLPSRVVEVDASMR